MSRKRNARETDPNLMTPKKQETEPVTLQSTSGETEAEDGAYGELDGKTYSTNEDTVKDEKRDAQETDEEEEPSWVDDNPPRGVEPEPSEEPEEPEEKVELEGETYKLLKINESVLQGNVIEYNNKFYTPLRLKEKVGEADIDYQGTVYRPRTHSLIEYGNRIYEAVNPHTDAEPPQDQALGDKDNVDDSRPLELPAEEEGGMVSGPPAGTEPTILEDDLKKTGENIVIKTRKGYRKLQVYEVETSSNKLENLKNRGLKKDDETKKKA